MLINLLNSFWFLLIYGGYMAITLVYVGLQFLAVLAAAFVMSTEPSLLALLVLWLLSTRPGETMAKLEN